MNNIVTNDKERKEEVGDILNTIFLYKGYSDYRTSKIIIKANE